MGRDDIERRNRTIIPVEKFAIRKDVTKGIKSFRDRQEKKRLQTAKALRSYEKAMKAEGYEAGKGASRRRDRKKSESRESSGHQRSNPYAKASQQAITKKEDIEAKRIRLLEEEKRKVRKVKERMNRTRLLSKKTRKGQPIMNNVAKDILGKLQKNSNE